MGRRAKFGWRVPCAGRHPHVRRVDAACSPADADGGSEATRVVIAHDYLTQRGGANAWCSPWPEPSRAHPRDVALRARRHLPGIRGLRRRHRALQRSSILRRHHRLGLPLYAPVFSRTHLKADLVVASTSGWAHGISASGRRLLYVHNTARWLYQVDDYLRHQGAAARSVAHALGRRCVDGIRPMELAGSY